MEVLQNRRDIGDQVIEDSLNDILERSLDEISNPILDQIGNQIDDDFQNPVQRTQTANVNADVANVGDLKFGQLKSRRRKSLIKLDCYIYDNIFLITWNCLFLWCTRRSIIFVKRFSFLLQST